MSLPVWERGLKPEFVGQRGQYRRSLPVWERGLKHVLHRAAANGRAVAPRVGAWIETARIIARS